MVLQVTQKELEARAVQIMQTNPDPNQLVSRIFGPLENWILALGPYQLMLIPWTQMWWQYDRVHANWEPTGIKAGTVEFVLVGEEIEARPVQEIVPMQPPVLDQVRSEPKEAALPPAGPAPTAIESVSTGMETQVESPYGAETMVQAKLLIWRLVFQTGPKVNDKIILGERLSLGREVDNDVVLMDPKVSRHHAVLQRQGEAYLLVDQGSRNGTYVNEERLIGPVLLKKDDKITIGGSDILVLVS